VFGIHGANMARRRFDADIFALSLNRPLPLLLSCRRHRRSCPSTKVAHLDDNLASRAVRLTASERALVASAVPSGDFKGDRFAGGAHANTFKAQMVAPAPSATAAAAAEPPAVAEAASGEGLFCLVVSVEVKPDRVDEFLAAMKIDAEGSRKEPGCRRFDVLRDSSDPNKFLFYEAYVDDAAVSAHKAEPHFAPWKAFKASGGVASQAVVFARGVFFGTTLGVARHASP